MGCIKEADIMLTFFRESKLARAHFGVSGGSPFFIPLWRCPRITIPIWVVPPYPFDRGEVSKHAQTGSRVCVGWCSPAVPSSDVTRRINERTGAPSASIHCCAAAMLGAIYGNSVYRCGEGDRMTRRLRLRGMYTVHVLPAFTAPTVRGSFWKLLLQPTDQSRSTRCFGISAPQRILCNSVQCMYHVYGHTGYVSPCTCPVWVTSSYAKK